MNQSRYKSFARNVFGVQTAEAGIEAFKNWLIRIGAPVTLEQVNISRAEVDKTASHIFRTTELSRMQTLYTLETLK